MKLQRTRLSHCIGLVLAALGSAAGFPHASYAAAATDLACRGCVGTTDLANSSVTNAKIANGSVTSAKIVDGTVGTTDLANSSVTSAKIVDGAVGATDLENSSVTSAKIADGAVDTADIKDGAIGTTDLANSSVTSAKIEDGSVTSAKIADGMVGTANLADESVSGAKITSGAITESHLAAALLHRIAALEAQVADLQNSGSASLAQQVADLRAADANRNKDTVVGTYRIVSTYQDREIIYNPWFGDFAGSYQQSGGTIGTLTFDGEGNVTANVDSHEIEMGQYMAWSQVIHDRYEAGSYVKHTLGPTPGNQSENLVGTYELNGSTLTVMFPGEPSGTGYVSANGEVVVIPTHSFEDLGDTKKDEHGITVAVRENHAPSFEDQSLNCGFDGVCDPLVYSDADNDQVFFKIVGGDTQGVTIDSFGIIRLGNDDFVCLDIEASDGKLGGTVKARVVSTNICIN